MKKIIIPIITLLIGIISFILWNNRIVSYITLDINPSIKINLDRKENVKSIIPLNDDAKDVVTRNLIGKNLRDTIDTIRDNLVDKGYLEPGDTTVLLHTSGNIESIEVKGIIIESLEAKEIHTDVIIIEKISKKDEELAQKYKISPAKASYINTAVEERETINIETIKDKSVDEIKETKETGKYCESGYFLEGDWCYKEVGKEPALPGKVCPNGYEEKNNTCYESAAVIETGVQFCNEGYELIDNDCVKKEYFPAEVTGYSCAEGELKTKYDTGKGVKGSGDSKDPVCVDPSTAKEAVTPCNLPAGDSTERMSSGGKCYWHRAPVIESGCPGKIRVNGSCWDSADNVYLCPYTDAERSKGEYCYKELKNVKPVPDTYKCEDGATLEGTKCAREQRMEPIPERLCPEGFTKTEDDRCLNYKNKISKKDGYYCEKDNTKLKGTTCVIYEIVESKTVE